MRVTIRAARDQGAQIRILAAASTLAERFGLSQELLQNIQVQRGDPAVRAMLEREAIADLLETLVDVTEITVLPMTDPNIGDPVPGVPEEVEILEDEPEIEEPAKDALAEAPKTKPEDAQPPATEILPDLKPELVEALVSAGYTSPEAMRSASIKDLMQIPGVGKRTAEKILGALGPHPQPEG
jgi:hypothetical protein